MIEDKSCKYCGSKFPSELLNTTNIGESVLCENCGTEVIKERDENAEIDNRIDDNNQTNGFFRRIYEKLRNRKGPIERVFYDSDFPVRFKDNFKIVVARLVFPHIRSLEIETTQIRERLELNQEILDDLYEKISPIVDQRVTDKFLINLHRMHVKEFDKWLKLVQKKIKVNKRFCQDFVIYLRWLIREVFIIITELWDEPELPRFEQVIRDDLRSFELNLSSLLIRNQGDKTKNCSQLVDLYQVNCIQDGKNKEFHHDGHLEFPKTLDSFKEYEFNKERESITDSIKEINELIEKNDISFRMFNALTGRYLSSSNRVELTAFEAATGMLCNLIRTTSLPRYIKDKKHLQKMILGGFYLRKGDKGFAELANQTNVRYGGIIYIIKPVKQFCVFPNILTLIYIGVTWKTLLVRFTEHVEDAVDSYMKDSDWSSRWIERLIQTAMEDFFKLQYPYISGISP